MDGLPCYPLMCIKVGALTGITPPPPKKKGHARKGSQMAPKGGLRRAQPAVQPAACARRVFPPAPEGTRKIIVGNAL